MRSKVTITLSITYLLFSLVWAQDISARTKDDIVLGINMTGTGYIGDLNYNANAGMKYFNVLPGFQATLHKDKNTFLTPAISLGYGRIVAQNPDLSRYVIFGPADNPDSYFEQPRYVRTDFVYGDVALRFTPIKNIHALVRPYLSAGVGGLLYFPLKNDTLPLKGLNLSRGESFSTTTTSIPLSVGTDVNLSRKVSINLGTNLRMPMNDYMDLYGAKLVPDRRKGNDLLVSFQVGANFRIFDAEKALNPVTLPPMQDALPEDTTLLASADPHAMPILLRPNADFMAVEEYSLLGSYPEGWVRLTILAQSIECDSIAKLADQRISGLYNENLQLRSQYTKLQYQLDHSENAAIGTENTARVDSLIRVVYNKESKIRELQEQLDATTPDQPTQSLGASTEIAEYEKQIIALNQEIAELKSGGATGDKSVGFTELEEKLKTITIEKEQLDADYATLKDQNKSIQVELENARRNPGSTEGGEPEVLQARIDSLIQENVRVMTEMNEMKKNYLVLQQDYDDLKGSNSGEMQNQLAALQAQNAEQSDIITKLKAENEQLTSQNLADIKNKLDNSTAYVDSTNARYERLAAAIGQYEAMLAMTKRQNDSLASETQRLQAMVNVSGNPAAIDSVREASYIVEINELRTAVATEQQVRKQAQDDVKIAGERNAALQDSLTKMQANIQDIAHGELEIARKRIEELEKTNAELVARSTVPSGDTLPENIVQNLQTEIESLKREKNDLMTKNEEYRRTIEIAAGGDIVADLQNQVDEAKRAKENMVAENDNLKIKVAELEERVANTDFGTGVDSAKATALLSQISTLTRERDSLSRVTIAFAEEEANGSGNEQVAALQQQLQLAEAQRDELKGVMDKIDQNGFAPLKKELETLKEENAALAARKNELEKELEVKEGSVSCEELAVQVKELESQNMVMRQQIEKNVVLQDQFIALQEELTIKSIELDNEKKKNEAFASKSSGDDSEKDNMIIELTNERDAYKSKSEETEKQLSTTRDQLAVLENGGGSTGNATARVNDLVAQNTRLQDSIASLNAALNTGAAPISPDVSSLLAQIEALESKNKEQENTIASLQQGGTINPTPDVNTAELASKVTRLEEEKAQLQADRDVLFEQLKKLGEGSTDDAVVALTERLNLVTEENKKLTTDLAEARKNSTTPIVGMSNASAELIALKEDVARLTSDKNKLEQENANLKSELEALKTGGDVNGMIAELNTQVTQLTDENNALREMVKNLTVTAGGGTSADPNLAELEEKLLTLQNQNAVLLEERDRYMNLYQTCNEALEKAGGSGVVNDGQLAVKEEENMQLKNQIDALENEINILKSTGTPVVANNTQLVADLDNAKSMIADLQTQLEKAKAAGIPTDISEKLAQQDAEIARLNTLINTDGGVGEEFAPILAQKEAEITRLQQDLATARASNPGASMDLVELISQKDAEITRLNRLVNELQANPVGAPNPNPDATAEIKVLMAEKLTMRQQIEDLNTQIATLKEGNPDAEKILALTEEVTVVRERLQEKEAEVIKLREELSQPTDMKTAMLEEQVAQLEKDKADLNKKIEEIVAQNAIPNESELVRGLRAIILAKDDEIKRLRERVSPPIVNTDGTPANLEEEVKLVREQNHELFVENENLRIALANALEELQRRGTNPGVADNNGAEYATLKADNEQLLQQKAALESRMVEMQGIIDGATGTGSAEKDMLIAQNSKLLEENEALKGRMNNLEVEIAALKANTRPVVDNTELETLRSQNSDLNGEIMTLKAEVSRITAQRDEAIAAGGGTAGGEEVAALRTQVVTLQDQLEKNTTFVTNSLAQHEADVKQINQLEADLRNAQNGTNPIVSAPSTAKDEEISRLNDRVDQLVNDNIALNDKIAKLSQAGFATQPGATNTESADLSRRIAELAARERRMTQRESYIEAKEEELSLEQDKAKGVKALEVELRMLEQKLKGFMNSNGEVMQDGSPCFPVSAFASKDDVMNRINDYFTTTANAKYEIVNGMMVYKNVLIPEIDKNKTMNVAFYMTISSEDANKRIFQGAFQYTGDKTYVTSEKYPTQSIRAIKLLQRLSQ